MKHRCETCGVALEKNQYRWVIRYENGRTRRVYYCRKVACYDGQVMGLTEANIFARVKAVESADRDYRENVYAR